MRVFDFIARMVTAMLVALQLGSCSVHEWPYEVEQPELPKYPITLYLNYEEELPLYQTVEYETRAEADHQVRYTLEVYKIVNEYLSTKELVLREVFFNEDVSKLENSITVDLSEGKYAFHVWTDYVEAGSTQDRYYNADDFSAIHITRHEGNNDFRDAFVGHLNAEVTMETTNLLITNNRPLAKFKFISTDLDEFIEEMLELKDKNGSVSSGDDTRGIDVSEYKIVIQYSQNMPSEYDHFLDIPVDITPNVRFESKIDVISDTEAELGFDYVFTNNSDFPTPITLVVYDKEGNSVAAVNDIPVPLRRGQLTIVQGRFLTQQASGGIGIDPSFEDPDYVYNVP